MSTGFAELVVEEAALAWLAGLGWPIRHGPDIAVDGPSVERSDPNYRDTVLERRLNEALARLNPELPPEALEDAYRRLMRTPAPSLVERNRAVHRMLVDGVAVEYRRADGSIGGDAGARHRLRRAGQQRLAGGQPVHRRRGPARAPAGHRGVRQRPAAGRDRAEERRPTRTPRSGRPSTSSRPTSSRSRRCSPSTRCWSISDGVQARIGTLDRRLGAVHALAHHRRARTLAAGGMPELQVLLEGVFEKRRFLDLVRHFIVFEDDGGGKLVKKMAGYHQFHAVNKAVDCDREGVAAPTGDRRVGVVWHTQGSRQEPDDGLLRRAGRSCTRRWRTRRSSSSPTATTWTTSSSAPSPRCQDLLRQTPVQAETAPTCANCSRSPRAAWSSPRSRSSCPTRRATSYPLLSDRRNIVVIADEAHRSQYDFIDGFARHMRDALPNASFIGFTGTPIELADANTRAVFGDYINVYDIQRAVEDGATVPIYYESRLAKLDARRSRAAEARRRVRGGDRGRGGRAQGEAQDASGRSWKRWSAPRSGSS